MSNSEHMVSEPDSTPRPGLPRRVLQLLVETVGSAPASSSHERPAADAEALAALTAAARHIAEEMP